MIKLQLDLIAAYMNTLALISTALRPLKTPFGLFLRLATQVDSWFSWSFEHHTSKILLQLKHYWLDKKLLCSGMIMIPLLQVSWKMHIVVSKREQVLWECYANLIFSKNIPTISSLSYQNVVVMSYSNEVKGGKKIPNKLKMGSNAYFKKDLMLLSMIES